MNQKGFASFLIALSFVLLIGFIGASYYFLNTRTNRSSSKQREPVQLSTIVVLNTPLPTDSSSLIPNSSISESQVASKVGKVVTIEESIERIKQICEREDYVEVALNSMHRVEGKYYASITLQDLNSNPDPLLNYVTSAKGLCGSISSTPFKLEKNLVSATEWDYRYWFSEKTNIGYVLVLNNNTWKFVLSIGARL